ncbi:52 kDa repressor of the inhibitor of the protein kinase [Trichomycterus rosablanca]|uniref:52 kDa repressor of the inhibitor of the protein kinase n=1 Tax=Trichomycterus rosablanca TaxID=2290929 RepID=UPI002F35368A
MGGCSAPNCSNSSTNGKQLFRFPKDPTRMKKWLENCRKNSATPCTRLCQDHFEESQFEEIARSTAGGRKLKPNAVPTLFNVSNPLSLITPHSNLPLKPETEKDLNVGDHGYARRQTNADLEEELLRTNEEAPCSLCPHYKTQLEQQQQHTARLRREVEEMRRHLHRLTRMEKGLQMFLSEDQIRALTLAKRSRRAAWSHSTVLAARKIRSAVGVKGYEFLRELGYPLPSNRTVCNRLEPKMMINASIQEDLAELGLGIITACDSPEENVAGDEGFIGMIA